MIVPLLIIYLMLGAEVTLMGWAEDMMVYENTPKVWVVVATLLSCLVWPYIIFIYVRERHE